MTRGTHDPLRDRFAHVVQVAVPGGRLESTHEVDDHPELLEWLKQYVGQPGGDWDWEWDFYQGDQEQGWCFAISVRDAQPAMLLKLTWGY